jgi:ferredoxin
METESNEMLDARNWLCQWTCRGCEARNGVWKQDIPQNVTSLSALWHHLQCTSCGKCVKDPPVEKVSFSKHGQDLLYLVGE